MPTANDGKKEHLARAGEAVGHIDQVHPKGYQGKSESNPGRDDVLTGQSADP